MSQEQFVYQSNNRIKRKELNHGLLINGSTGFTTIPANSTEASMVLSCANGTYTWIVAGDDGIKNVTPSTFTVKNSQGATTTIREKNDIFLAMDSNAFSRLSFPVTPGKFIFEQDNEQNVSIIQDPLYSTDGFKFIQNGELRTITTPSTSGNYLINVKDNVISFSSFSLSSGTGLVYSNSTDNSIKHIAIPNGILIGNNNSIETVELTAGALVISSGANSINTLPTPTSGARIDLKVSGGYIGYEENRMKIYKHSFNTQNYVYTASAYSQIAGNIITDTPSESNIYCIYAEGYVYFDNLTVFENCNARNTYKIDLCYGSATDTMVISSQKIGPVAENLTRLTLTAYVSGREIKSKFGGNAFFIFSDIPTTAGVTLESLNLTVIRH